MVKRTLALTYFEKSIAVPQRTVRDALNSFKERNIIFITKAMFPDNSGKMQKMTTVEINVNTNQWITKLKKRAIVGWSINDFITPKPDPEELKSLLDRIHDDAYQYAEGETYELELPDGTLEYFGEDLQHALARLNPVHPKLKSYYQNMGTGWTMGFQLYG